MRPIALIMYGAAPLIAALLFVYIRRNTPEGFSRLLAKGFFAGCAGALALLLAEYLSFRLGLNMMSSLKRIIFFSFVTIAATAELVKLILLKYYLLPRQQFRRPMDVVVLSIMVSLGFSSVAICFFLLNLFDLQSVLPSTFYAFAFVPANIMFAVIMGFFVGMAKFLKARVVYSFTGLAVAWFFHGIFNFCMLTNDFKLLTLFSFGTALIVLFLSFKASFSNPDPSEQ